MTKTVLRMVICALILLAAAQASAMAEDDKKPPPLPLLGIEGYGGVAITYSAYLVNPPRPGDIFGKPAIESGAVFSPSGRVFAFGMISENIAGRVELSYGFDFVTLHNLPRQIEQATNVNIGESDSRLHNFNARLLLLKEGDFEQPWLPAVTFGVHYKYNDGVNNIDNELGGALTKAGITDNQGEDFTLYFSKMLKCLPRPVLVNAGVRYSNAAHIGLLGFAGDRQFLGEGNILIFLTDKLIIGAEYRMKPNNYTPIANPAGGWLVGPEDDWWSVVAAYAFTNRFTLAGGVFNFGQVLNHTDNGAIGFKMKYEF